VGFVRWTEQRNFEAVIGHDGGWPPGRETADFPSLCIDERRRRMNCTGAAPTLGNLLQYPTPEEKPDENCAARRSNWRTPVSGTGESLLLAGAGNYAGAVLIPAFREAGAR